MTYYQKYWDKFKDPMHVIENDAFYQSYIDEIRFYLGEKNTIVDTGCGRGEIIVRLADYYDKIYAIDFTYNMLDQAKALFEGKRSNHVEFIKANMLDIDQVLKEKVDVIYNNQVIQYLTEEEIESFVKKSKALLNDEGRIVLMHIPNLECKNLFQIEFYRTTKLDSINNIVKRKIALNLNNFKSKLFKKDYHYDDGIGYWFYPTLFYEIADRLGLDCQVYGPRILGYRYRFHVVLELPKQN